MIDLVLDFVFGAASLVIPGLWLYIVFLTVKAIGEGGL